VGDQIQVFCAYTPTPVCGPVGPYDVNTPVALAFDGTYMWVAGSSVGIGMVSQLNLGGTTVTSYGSFTNPVGLAFDGSNIWVADETYPGTVTMIPAASPYSGFDAGIGAPIAVGNYPTAIVFDGSYIWVANSTDGTVTAINGSGEIVGTYSVGMTPEALAVDSSGVLWVANSDSNNVMRLGTFSSGGTIGQIMTTTDVGNRPDALAFDGEHMWVGNFNDGSVTELSLNGGIMGTHALLATTDSPTGIAFDGTNIWVSTAGASGKLYELAPSGAVLHSYAVGSNPLAVAFDGASIWVANAGSNTVEKM
jgi:hypothetical protein